MATTTHSSKLQVMHMDYVQKRDQVVEKLLVRPCMVFSAGLVVLGLCILLLMLAEFLPLSLGFCFLSFVLIAVGSIFGLIMYGEL